MERTRVTEAVGAVNEPGAENAEVRPAALGTGLVVELDRQLVRAVLFASVEGHGRMVATSAQRSSALPPIDDTSVSVRQVIRGIEEQLGIEILGPEGVQVPPVDDVGVDFFAVTGHPVAATRLTIVPLGESPVSRALVDAAARSTTVVDVVGPDVRTSDGVVSGALFEQNLRTFRPDTVVLVEGGSAIVEWSTVIGTLAGLMAEQPAAQVIVIASEHYQLQAAQMLGENADLRGIDPADFAPADIASALETELQALYDSRLNPSNTVQTAGVLRFVNPMRAVDLVTRFLARRRDQGVICVSSGDGTTLHWAEPTASDARVRPDLDAFTNVRTVLTHDPDTILRWLPFTSAQEDLSHWVLNRALRPFTESETFSDLAWESAVVTAPLRELWSGFASSRDAKVELIVAGRPWAQWHSPALAVLALLNTFQPRPKSGLVEIVLDTDGIVAGAGALGEQSPAMAADAVEIDLAVPAASVVVVEGVGTDGDLAARGQLRLANGEVTRFSVPYGSLHRLELQPGIEATLTLTCEPRFSIGGQTAGEEIVFGRATPLRGSEVGIVIDARGRPLQLPSDPTLRAARVAGWLDELGAKRGGDQSPR